jgi:hypothetical protein
MHIFNEGGQMVDEEEQEKIKYVTAALLIGGADTVGDIVSFLNVFLS